MTENNHPARPQSNRLADHMDEYNTLREFLDWLGGQGILLARFETSELRPDPIHDSLDSLALRFLGVDAAKLDKERQDLLKYVQRSA